MSPLKNNLRLSVDLARQDLANKYRRSIIGPLWMLLTPLCLLGVYSLVFSRIFGIEWHASASGHANSVGFVLPFFTGLVIYLVLSDVVNASTTLFAGKRNFVGKSAFPIWVLWLSNLLRVAANGLIGFALARGRVPTQQEAAA